VLYCANAGGSNAKLQLQLESFMFDEAVQQLEQLIRSFLCVCLFSCLRLFVCLFSYSRMFVILFAIVCVCVCVLLFAFVCFCA